MNKNVLSPHTACWVPTCKNTADLKKKLFYLSSATPRLRETWLALATKSAKGIPDAQIFFCEDHFQAINLEFTIDNTFYSQQQNAMIPTRNMPDQVCRTCNEFIGNKEALFTMSTWITVDMPKVVEDQLTNMISPVDSKPLYQMFSYCFSEFAVPSDPVTIICNKCYENIWLFFVYKKNAIVIEDMLSQDFTPEEYGQNVLCRTCSIERSNFFNLDDVSELGTLLQDILMKRYSPKLVPLRVCLNCYNILQKINGFYKTFMTTEKIIKRRSLLNEKLKMFSSNSPRTLSINQIGDKQGLLKKCENENLILAKLMLQYGQKLRNNLHVIENWEPICHKLEEHKINHNVPSLINNWKRLQKMSQKKSLNQTPLSELEELVLKFMNRPLNKPDLDATTVIKTDSPGLSKSNSLQSVASSAKTTCQVPDAKQGNMDLRPPSSTNQPEGIDESCQTEVAIKNDVKESLANAERKKRGRPPKAFAYANKLILAKAICAEFNKVPVNERTNKSLWKDLVKRVARKKILPYLTFDQLHFQWINLKRSATIYEKNGPDEVDNMIWGILKTVSDQKALNKSPVKTRTGESDDCLQDDETDVPKIITNINKTQPKEDQSKVEAKMAVKRQFHFTNSGDKKLNQKRPNVDQQTNPDNKKLKPKPPNVDLETNPDNKKLKPSNVDPETKPDNKKVNQNSSTVDPEILKRQLFVAIKDVYDKVVKNNLENKHGPIWKSVFDELYDNRRFDVLSRKDAEKMWVLMRTKVSNTFSRKSEFKGFYYEVHLFLEKVRMDKEAFNNSNKLENKSQDGQLKENVHIDSSKSNVISTKSSISTTNPNKVSPKDSLGVKHQKSEITNNSNPEGALSYVDPDMVLKRRLFMDIKDTFKELRQNGLKKCKIWREVFNLMYDERGYDLLTRPKAEVMWSSIRIKANNDMVKNKTCSDFYKEVYRFIQKTKKSMAALEKQRPNKRKVDGTSVAVKKARLKPEPVPVVNKTTIENVVNKSISTTVPEKASPEKKVKDCEPITIGKDINQVKFWTEEEKLNYLRIMCDNEPYLHNKKEYWLKVVADFKKQNERILSDTGILMQWPNLQERFMIREKNKLDLDAVDKIVKKLMDKFNKDIPNTNDVTTKNDTPTNNNTTTNNDTTTNKNTIINKDTTNKNETTTNNGTTTNNASLKTSVTKSVNPVVAETERIKKEIQPLPQSSQSSITYDLTYDYVSLEDLQQSTTWDMPNLKIENNEINFVVAKVEGGVDLDTSFPTTADAGGEDSRESREDVAVNQSYVGANDLMTVESESDEE